MEAAVGQVDGVLVWYAGQGRPGRGGEEEGGGIQHTMQQQGMK